MVVQYRRSGGEEEREIVLKRPLIIYQSMSNSVVVNRGDIPWATAFLTVWMAGLYLLDPMIDGGVEYFLLSPWMHSTWPHFWNNLAFFLPFGVYTEWRTNSVAFVVFAALIPYLALHLPVVWGLGELSQGASGLTKALTSYLVMTLLIGFKNRLERIIDHNFGWRETAVAVLMLLAIAFLGLDACVTVQRFFYLAPRPKGMSVASHFIGLILGVLWFSYRTWQHGLDKA